jgi:ABC-type nitrate/sulfonate/bicarbonate transport system substrate-binding protein
LPLISAPPTSPGSIRKSFRSFAAVMSQAGRWANAHRKESATILERWMKIEVAPTMPRVVYADRLSAAQTQPLIDVAAKYGVLEAPFPAHELFASGTGNP